MSSTCHACPKVFWGFVFWQVSAFYWWNSAVIQSLSTHLTSQWSSALAQLKFRIMFSWRSEESPVEACRSPRSSDLFIISWKYSPDLSESNPRPIRFEPSTTRRGSSQSLFFGGGEGGSLCNLCWMTWAVLIVLWNKAFTWHGRYSNRGPRWHARPYCPWAIADMLTTVIHICSAYSTVPPPVTECQGLSTVVLPNYCLLRCCRSTDSFTPSLFEY